MSKGEEKSSAKEKRSSIIDAVSDWIKLLALIVLVAEAVILVAMWQTPHDHSMYPIYPFIMVFLLLIVIVAVIYDRTQERKSKIVSVSVGENALAIDSAKTRAPQTTSDKNSYSNSLLKYSINLPSGNDWSEPKEIGYFEFYNSILVQSELKKKEFKQNLRINNPYGKMLINANILQVCDGEPALIGFDQESSTGAVEHQIKEWLAVLKDENMELPSDEAIQERRNRLLQMEGDGVIAFGAKLNVMTYHKKDIDFDYMSKGLTNLFLTMAMSTAEPIDSLMANDDTILWVTRTKLINALVNEERHSSFYIYRLYQLLDGNGLIYMNTAQWSPQLESSVATWDSLKNSFESFKIKK
ncbi:MAG: hypothetical protein ABJM06_01910 [Gilvibacter sp.]